MKTAVAALTDYSAWNSSGPALLLKFSGFVCFKCVYVCSDTMELLLLWKFYEKGIYSKVTETWQLSSIKMEAV
jgi:hypothetical protein